MTDRTQPEAVADCIFRLRGLRHVDRHEVAHAMESMVARIADLEAQLEAIGAGGVSGPLIGQPQAMPDLSQLTERGAKAWAGVDAQGLREGFTAADMATVSAQGFRDGVASLTAQAADSAQEEAARLDFLIEQGAYVVSDPDACPGYWLHWARPDGSTWVQGDEHPTPRAAIDAAMNKGGAT